MSSDATLSNCDANDKISLVVWRKSQCVLWWLNNDSEVRDSWDSVSWVQINSIWKGIYTFLDLIYVFILAYFYFFIHSFILAYIYIFIY